VIKLDKKQVTE